MKRIIYISIVAACLIGCESDAIVLHSGETWESPLRGNPFTRVRIKVIDYKDEYVQYVYKKDTCSKHSSWLKNWRCVENCK